MLIIFDYDGVIVDSFPNIHQVYLRMCEELGVDCPADIEVFREVYGKHHLLGYENLGIVGDLVARADAIFMREVVKGNPPLYPHLRETLAALKREHTLVLVSATVPEEIEQKMRRHGLTPYFERVISTVTTGQDKAHVFKHVMLELGATDADTIAVGDRVGDYEAAKDAGVSRIVITRYGWGFDEHRVPGAAIAERPEDLLRVIHESSRHKK